MSALPRDLHPVAWWLWAIGLASYATQTTNPWLLLLIVSVAALVVVARRSEQPWARSFRLYLGIATVMVAVRVVFRALLDPTPGTVWIPLPAIPLPSWMTGVTLLGDVTRESVLGGLYDGLRLATIVVCLGAANALANPKRLLRSVPPALYEIGTALVVAVTVVPQLADSVQRVHRAQQLRAGQSGRVAGVRRTLVPVLEDALERSMALAAGMDARGYGRSGEATPGERRATGALMLTGLVGLCVGVFAVLDDTAPRWLATPMVAAGLVLSIAGMGLAGRRVRRTVYRPDPWRLPEWLVVVSGLAVGLAGYWVGHHQGQVAYPGVSGWPPTSAVALLGALIGVAPALAAPMPAMVTA